MKYAYSIPTAVAVALLAVGCKPTENDPYTPATNNLPRASQPSPSASEPVRSATNYSYAQKDQFVALMRGEIAELNKEADQLGDRIERSSAGAREEAKVRLQELRGKISEVEKQLNGAQNANADTWEEMKAGFNRSYEEMKKTFNEGRQWLSEKIAP